MRIIYKTRATASGGRGRGGEVREMVKENFL
jgi:hypothetical protein